MLNLNHLTYLCVEWEGVKHHGADEGDVCRLAVVDSFTGIYPQPSKFRQNINCFKSLQVVNKNIGNPKIFYQLQIY